MNHRGRVGEKDRKEPQPVKAADCAITAGTDESAGSVKNCEPEAANSAVTDGTIARVAALSELELSCEEVQERKRDLAAMLACIDRLNELDTTGVSPLYNVAEAGGLLREDIVTNGDGRTQTLSNAPAVKDGGIVTPRTIEEREDKA